MKDWVRMCDFLKDTCSIPTGRGSGYGAQAPLSPRPWSPHKTATATQELLKACPWGPEEKQSVGELLPLRWDYFYAGNLDFLIVCSLRIPIFTSQDLAARSTCAQCRGEAVSGQLYPPGSDGIGTQGALTPSPDLIPFFH